MSCEHNIIVGDNYGSTCQVCGEIIEGYGEFIQSMTCKHRFLDGFCVYCEERDPNEMEIKHGS